MGNTTGQNTDWLADRSERFLRHFRVKERIQRLTDTDVRQLREAAATGDAYAQYGLGRWLYYSQPSDTAMSEAEELLLASKDSVPDALAAYAMMWRYGETRENTMDVEKCSQLLQIAQECGSVRAAMQLTRARIFGLFCEAEPEAAAREIEQRLAGAGDHDPHWHTLLAFAYEELKRNDDAIDQYEQAIAQGETSSYAYLSYLYYWRGNMALYEEMMEEGIAKGSTLCMTYQVDMSEDEFLELDETARQQLHDDVDRRLHYGLELCDGKCAYYLWQQYYYGGLGYEVDKPKSFAYLKQGVRLGDFFSIKELVECALYNELPPEMALSADEAAELRLQAVRYDPTDETSLRRLRLVTAPAFLLRHKDEMERYWQPRFDEIARADEEYKRNSPFWNQEPKVEKTPIEPSVIVIWPTGHLDIREADVYKMKSYREMAETLIGAEGLDAVYFSQPLADIGKEARLDMPLVMYVDRDGYAKNLADNAIGTLLCGQGQEVRGPVIVCQTDQVHECHSFAFKEDLESTYREINSHCGGLLIIRDEDDGR